MATVLLSISTNTLYGIGMSEHFGPLTKRPVKVPNDDAHQIP